jgi:hypothetical protein|eukprot:CAMPEP_0174336004 /NCGR_PEP_ID=MMETSP0810-20121108/21243_1 /TAXON_ID=73025 ORGANISM="Eutreptiella gymnastica-like, Strain CCMP1594" /NCGR_SAMPLE_ID=MMETSP0810 /ASSEMBLY_ACC=CAM_ASM_000659 /LENGTH=100 /DNA_ID=CAMNT_0015454737 /DNA_START=346 /DNA_END=648 /DNA_ORIENTATION=-
MHFDMCAPIQYNHVAMAGAWQQSKHSLVCCGLILAMVHDLFTTPFSEFVQHLLRQSSMLPNFPPTVHPSSIIVPSGGVPVTWLEDDPAGWLRAAQERLAP